MHCEFKKVIGLIPCDNHIYTDIYYNNNLNLWLCPEHEKEIIKDHCKNFIKNRLVYRNENYQTLSNDIRERILNLNFNIPNTLNYSQCLFFYYFQNIAYTYNINIYLQRIYTTIIHIKIPKYVENFNNYAQLGMIVLNNLDLYISVDEDINPDIDIEGELYNINGNIENVIFNNNYNNYNNYNNIYSIGNEHFERFILTEIKECNICLDHNNLELGFEMRCCNKTSTVCARCIITEYIVNELKYKSAFDITDFHFIRNKLKCSFCRKENNYIELLYNTYTQKLCIDVLKQKCNEECENRVKNHIELIENNINY